MRRTGRGRGREGGRPQLRTLLAIASHLQHKGDALTINRIAKILGNNRAKAQEHIDLLMGVGDNDTPFYLPLLDNGSEVALARDPDYVCKKLRFSKPETAAFVAALNRVGLEEDDPLCRRIMDCFGSPEGLDDLEGTTARPNLPGNTVTLKRCKIAIESDKSLVFDYQGTKDSEPRERRVKPKRLHQDGELWKLDAYDYDADGERTFFITHMSTPQLLREPMLEEGPQDGSAANRRTVTLYFADKHMLDLLEWPGLERVSERDGVVEARIPFYGGPWLVHRIASGGGSITTDDEELTRLVKDYASGMLSE